MTRLQRLLILAGVLIIVGGLGVWAYVSKGLITEGVHGTITMRSGDCMPGPRELPKECSGVTYTEPLTVIIKRPVDLTNKENKEVVKTLDGVRGTFKTELPPGLYNMYVVYKGEEYCNSFGGHKGEDCEFSVTQNHVTDYKLLINEATD